MNEQTHPAFSTLTPHTTPTPSGSTIQSYSRSLSTASPTTPILILIHGYPQSSYIFRNLLRHLPLGLPLFIPDIPGYGKSSALHNPATKHALGLAILAALQSLLPSKPNQQPQPIILCGHDRGARICHHLALYPPDPSSYKIVGDILIDIVPFTTEWKSMTDPSKAVKVFHWPLLANVEIATKLIMGMGGDVWCKTLLEGAGGKSEKLREMVAEGGAVEVYTGYFRKEEVIRGSCEDYAAGSKEDVELERKALEEGRKIEVETLVIFADGYLGWRLDVAAVWKTWVKERTGLRCERIGGGVGHYVVEEAAGEVAGLIGDWLKIARIWEG